MNAHNVAGIFAAVFLATIGTTSSQLGKHLRFSLVNVRLF